MKVVYQNGDITIERLGRRFVVCRLEAFKKILYITHSIEAAKVCFNQLIEARRFTA